MKKLTAEQENLIIELAKELPPCLALGDNEDNLPAFINELWDVFYIDESKRKVYPQKYDDLELLVQLVTMQYATLTLWIEETSTPDCTMFRSLTCNISNTIVAIEKLAQSGLDFQAMTLVRNLFEQFMTLLIVTESPQKREAFRKSCYGEKARNIWHKYFTKTKFLKMLKAYCNNESHYALFEHFINESYGELSSFAHNDYLYTLCYSLAEPEAETHPLNLMGEYVSRVRAIYGFIISTIWVCNLLFYMMLADERIDISLTNLLSPKVQTETKKLIYALHAHEVLLGCKILNMQDEFCDIIKKLKDDYFKL